MGFQLKIPEAAAAKPYRLIQRHQKEGNPGVEQHKEKDGGDHRKGFAGHFRPQDAGGKVQHALKNAFHQGLKAARRHRPPPRPQDEKQDDKEAGNPGGKEGIGNGELGKAQGGKVVFLVTMVVGRRIRRMFGIRRSGGGMVGGGFFRCRVMGIRIPQAAFHGGKGKDRLRREMNLRLRQEGPFQPEHSGANGPHYEPGD